MSFADEVRSKLTSIGWKRPLYPSNLLDIWEDFIEEVKNGYGMCKDEYDNDLSIRNAIEKVLADESLKRFDDYAVFASKIGDLDIAFKKLLSPTESRPGDTWWMRGVPRYGCQELAQDFEVLHGATVEVTK